MSDFISNNYEERSSSDNYMKFTKEENAFRILTKPVMGWLYWLDSNGNVVPRGMQAGKGGKPVRVQATSPSDLGEIAGTPAQNEAVFFWAMIVYNYDLERVQILELKQATIRKGILSLARNKKWGSPLDYDLAVMKEGEGKDVEYTVVPAPKEPFKEDVGDISKIDLTALFRNEDPFANYYGVIMPNGDQAEVVTDDDIPF